MLLRVLFVGRFDDDWLSQFRTLGEVVEIETEEEAVKVLSAQSFDLVFTKDPASALNANSEVVPLVTGATGTESQQELFLRSVLDNLPHMIFVKEAKDLRFVRWNKAGAELIGTPSEEIVGNTDFDLFSAEQAVFFQKIDREVLATGVLCDIPEEILDTRGGPRVLHTKKIPICDEQGEPRYLLGISEDITERKRLESQLASRFESAREAERRHIARELHDELGQLLTALRLDLGRLQAQLSPELRREAESMSNLLDHTVKTVRRLSTELRPQILDDLGLRAALEWLSQNVSQRGLHVDLDWDLTGFPLQDEARTAFFRISQEALNNVVRHAKARKVRMKLAFDGRELCLRVSDDGQGFKMGESLLDNLGLLGMKERISLLGGQLSIETAPGRGTVVTARAPRERCLSPAKPSAK